MSSSNIAKSYSNNCHHKISQDSHENFYTKKGSLYYHTNIHCKSLNSSGKKICDYSFDQDLKLCVYCSDECNHVICESSKIEGDDYFHKHFFEAHPEYYTVRGSLFYHTDKYCELLEPKRTVHTFYLFGEYKNDKNMKYCRICSSNCKHFEFNYS